LVRVRTGNGTEGWVDANLLLSAQQMDELRKLSEDSRKLLHKARPPSSRR